LIRFSALSLWSLCVLLCVYRRLRTCPVSATLGYRKIAQEFRRIGNTVDSRVRVPSDLAVYRELDRLVDYGLLITDSKANNRCSLNVHSKTLGNILRGVTLPMAIGYWFDTQTDEVLNCERVYSLVFLFRLAKMKSRKVTGIPLIKQNFEQ
ncbi:hypothetical protein COOONC_03823, partial [Cooperia oncophora]